MKPRYLIATTALALAVAGAAFAQSAQNHDEHHPDDKATQTQPAPSMPQGGMMNGGMQGGMMQGGNRMQGGMMQNMPMGNMQNMPSHCRAAIQKMPEDCQSMMSGNSSAAANQPASTKAYLAASAKMHGPMDEGLMDKDPDAAFVKGMIPHHQGAIDMAKVRLQYGKDEQTKKWAADIIAAQEREIKEMQDWLKKRGQ